LKLAFVIVILKVLWRSVLTDKKEYKRRLRTAGAMSIPMLTGAAVTGGKRFGEELGRSAPGGKIWEGLKQLRKSKTHRAKVFAKARGAGKAGAALGLAASLPYAISNELYLRARPKTNTKTAMGAGCGVSLTTVAKKSPVGYKARKGKKYKKQEKTGENGYTDTHILRALNTIEHRMKAPTGTSTFTREY
jgi:hypothetical protein